MPTLIVTTREGQEITLPGASGASVMEAIRDGGVDELLAICGGCRSCATCHVYIDTNNPALPPMTEEEDDLLSGSTQRDARSRLSCQILLTEALEGLRVTIAPED